MSLSVTTSQTSGLRAYIAQSLAAGAGDKSALPEESPVGGVRAAAPVAEKGFGFQFGKLGIHFSTEDPGFDPEELAQAAKDLSARMQKQQSAAFAEEMEIAGLRSSLFETPKAEAFTPVLSDSPLSVRQGLAAYAKTARAARATRFQPSMSLGIV